MPLWTIYIMFLYIIYIAYLNQETKKTCLEDVILIRRFDIKSFS